jgi:hypothetical protein
MNSIRTILASKGQDAQSMEIGESVKVAPDSQAVMPVVIEKTDDTELCVGHYHTQAGDLMSDPEVHFELDGTDWIPIRYIQHPGIEREDPTGLDLDGFLEIWDQNIRRQGFMDTIGE